MAMVNVKFIDKEYMIPSDVIKYVDFVEFTNSVIDNLMRTFARKIRNIEAIEDNNFMISDINTEASKFISKLLENDIYDRTVNDYLKENKGFNLFIETKERTIACV